MRSFLLVLPAVALSFVAMERDASACGGCFTPTDNPTVVNDHRMILSIGKDKSTLYDQIKYSGSPSSFAWVLPIAGTVDVGLSADVVFSALDQQTQTSLIQPPQNCPPPPEACQFGASRATGGSSSGASGASNDEGSVQVLKNEVVGPYETVQLSADDPAALDKWLGDNGFNIPADVKPVIGAYVTEKFNFLALKLVPGKGVQDMRPVRVTTVGAGAVLPLRMVAAGTGPVVGIGLWVVSEGRYEPQNFPSFKLDVDEVAWDWTAQKSNYVELRAAKTAAANGRIWEIESSSDVLRSTITSIVGQGTYSGEGPYPSTDEERAAQDYLPVKDAQGNILKTAKQVRDEDLDVLFGGTLVRASARVTRLRADLAHASLDQDLQMTASKDQSVFPPSRQLTKELNEPLCPVWDGCSSVGSAPRSEAIARTQASNASGSSCAVSPQRKTTFIAAGVGLLGLVITQAMRRRRR